jgi:acyl-CoA oxidase
MNKTELSDLLFGDDPSKREKWFEMFKDPVFVPRYNMDWETTRNEPYKKLIHTMKSGLVSVKDFYHDPKNIFLAHELLGQLDAATATKFTVQFNLFGGTMTALSTERHQKYFDMIDNASVVGCFCLTELGFGNNAIKMETTVTYDEASKEFIINCPTVLS